jgi:hypothetical protein
LVATLEPAGETQPALSFVELPVNNSRDALIANVRANARRGLPELKQQGWTDTPLVIAAGGPSLTDRLPMLKAIRETCHVLSVNGAYKFLRENGVESDHFVLIDSRPENIVHVDSPHEDTNHCLASQVHPKIFDALRDYGVTIFHLGTEATMEARQDEPEPKSWLAAPVGMASVHAIYIGAALGYRTHMLLGYDFSRREDQNYAFSQPMNDSVDSIEVEVAGKKYQTTVALAVTAEQFRKAISPIIRSCDLDVRIFSTGLLPDLIRHNQEH